MRQKIIVELEQAPDRIGLWDIVNITNGEEEIESCEVTGLIQCKTLTVGGWIRKPELKGRTGIGRKNPHLKFVLKQIGDM